MIELSSQTNKAADVLGLLLPHFVTTRVKNGTRYISEDQGIVTVLFCNICDFEETLADLTPYELAGFLDELFGKFDQLCEIVGVTKIETVGKTYMASAGLKDSDAELDPNISKVSHARRIIELGFGMIQIIQRTVLKHKRLHIKIGINSGRVTAGVVGFHKPQFSLVGDTVNTASRMASTLKENNSIQITNDTYELVKDNDGIVFIQNVSFVKGKGNMNTFIVKVKNKADSAAYDSNGLDPKGSMVVQNIAEYIHSHNNSTPGITTDDNSPVKPKKKTYGLIEYRETLLFKKKSSGLIERIQFFSFSCNESEKEQKFRIKTLDSGFKTFYFGLLIAMVVYSLLLIIELSELFITYKPEKTVSLWLTIALTVIYSVLFFRIRKYFHSFLFA